MDKSKLVWNDAALERDSAPIAFTVLSTRKGSEPQKEEVTFYELSRTQLSNYLKEIEDVNVAKPTAQGAPQKSKELTEVSDETLQIVFRYLSLSTDGKKKPEWFAALDLTASATGRLLGFMHQLNHVEEILLSQGNWAALPGVMEMMSKAGQESLASD